MPTSDDQTLCSALQSALRVADQAGDHNHGQQARAIVRALIDDLLLRSRLRDAIAEAISSDSQAQAHRLRNVLLDADAQSPGWQADAFEALDDG